MLPSLAAFQDYLRTQAGNTTTVNIIIYTVDYLLRLQESISDFYWHYSDHDTIDLSGRENFLKAFKVAKQVFRTLTEYIQVGGVTIIMVKLMTTENYQGLLGYTKEECVPLPMVSYSADGWVVWFQLMVRVSHYHPPWLVMIGVSLEGEILPVGS